MSGPAIGVVSTLVLVVMIAAYLFRPKREHGISKTDGDISTLALGVNLYAESTGRFPSQEEGLAALVTRPVSLPEGFRWIQQMTSLPKDPWNHDYIYEQPGRHNHSTFDISSAGPDGKPGTADDSKNW